MSENEYKMPSGYKIESNGWLLFLMEEGKTSETNGVHAVCRAEDGIQELLKRFYQDELNQNKGNDDTG